MGEAADVLHLARPGNGRHDRGEGNIRRKRNTFGKGLQRQGNATGGKGEHRVGDLLRFFDKHGIAARLRGKGGKRFRKCPNPRRGNFAAGGGQSHQCIAPQCLDGRERHMSGFINHKLRLCPVGRSAGGT